MGNSYENSLSALCDGVDDGVIGSSPSSSSPNKKTAIGDEKRSESPTIFIKKAAGPSYRSSSPLPQSRDTLHGQALRQKQKRKQDHNIVVRREKRQRLLGTKLSPRRCCEILLLPRVDELLHHPLLTTTSL